MVNRADRDIYVVIAWPERVELDRAQAFGNPAPRLREHLTFVAQDPRGSRAEGFVVTGVTPKKHTHGMLIRAVRIAHDSGKPEAIRAATKVMVSTGGTFAVLPFNPSSICDTEAEVRAMMEIPDMWRAREELKTPSPEPKTWKNSITITSPTGETSRAERLYRDGSFGLTISDPSPPMPSKAWMERMCEIEPPQEATPKTFPVLEVWRSFFENGRASIAAIPMVDPSLPPPEPEPTWLEEDLVPPITSQEYMEKFNKKR